MALGEKKSVVMEEQMGVPGGVATLDEGGKLTQSQIPSMDFAEAGTKNTLDDGDAVAITDSTEDNATKRVLWSTVKSLLGNLFVPLTRTVNGKALSSDITLSADNVGARANTWTPTADQVGAVPTSRKINNKALSSDVTLTASDVGAVPTSRRINNKALSSDVTLSAADVNAVPTTRTVNGKALSSNVTLTGADINVSGSDSTPISTALSNKADKTAPTEYDLPLAAGWSNISGCRSKYFKTEDKVVTVICTIKSENTASSDGTLLATLPVGYRPVSRLKLPVLVVSTTGVISPGYVDINTNGTFMMYRVETNARELEISPFTFIAAS